MKADRPTLIRILDRIQDGCYTVDQIGNCSECGHRMFTLDDDQILRAMKILVRLKKAEWRTQGKIGAGAGYPTMLCMPKGSAAGTGYQSNRPRGDENQP